MNTITTTFTPLRTHDAHKEVPEDKGANPDPHKDVGTGKGHIGDFDEVIIDLVPLVQGEQLEERDHCIRERTVCICMCMCMCVCVCVVCVVCVCECVHVCMLGSQLTNFTDTTRRGKIRKFALLD